VDRPNFDAKWRFDAGAKINSGLALVGDALIFDTFGKQVIALDVRNGSVVWRTNTDNTMMSSAAISNGIIFVGSGDSSHWGSSEQSFPYATDTEGNAENFWGRPEGDHVLAIDAATGRKRWQYRTSGEDMPSAGYANGFVIFANGDGHAYGLLESSGDARWRADLPGIATMASTTIFSRTAVVSVCDFAHGGAGATVALNVTTGAVIWRSPYGNCDSSPAYGAGRVFVSGVVGNRQSFGYGGYTVVAALDAKTGKLDWRYQSANRGPYSSVGTSERAIAGTFADGMYFQALPTESALIALDAHTGATRWHFRAAAPVKMSPIVYKGRVFFGDVAGLLYELRGWTNNVDRSSAPGFSLPRFHAHHRSLSVMPCFW
jgi:outer membrane protein assembly factor BamB